MRVLLCLCLISMSISAEVYFTDTKEETTLKKTYSRAQMKNKKVAKVNAFANREYYVFLGRDVNPFLKRYLQKDGEKPLFPKKRQNGHFAKN